MDNEYEIFMEKKDPIGYVYIVRCSKTKYYKIGRALNLADRLSELQVGCPYQLKYVFWAEMVRPKWVESAIHKRFIESRHKREWFKLTENEVSFIKEHLQKTSNNYMLTNYEFYKKKHKRFQKKLRTA